MWFSNYMVDYVYIEIPSESHWRMNMGNSFHNLGAAFWKARSL